MNSSTRALPTLLLALTAPLAGRALTAQDEPAPEPSALIERFEGLGFRQKAAIVRTLQRQLSTLDDPALARIRVFYTDASELPDAPDTAPVFDPAVTARAEHEAGRAPARTPLPEDDERYRAAKERYRRPGFLPELHREVTYDWCQGQLVKLPALGYDAWFANVAHGHAPGTDQAVAVIQSRLDRGDEMRELAFWFGHAYCDLDARSYPGLTLYDVWYSGKVVDIPDVDAIPFAHEILGKTSMRSPLSGPPRDRLYQEIAAASGRYRTHRTLCEAAAAAFVAAEPDMDPRYALMVPRFHYLFAKHDDDLDEVVKVILATDRDTLLREVDEKIRQSDGAAWELREGRKKELATMHARIRTLAKNALDQFGG